MQRGRRRRGKSGGPPRPREQIRPLQRPVSADKFASSRVEPFSFLPDKILPGTLRHSGNRPAPPSDHTPLARRSAFQHGRKRGWRGNSDAPAGLKYFQREDFCRACARRRCLSAWNHGTLRFHSRYCRRVRTLTRSETPGFWLWQFRIGDLVRSGKIEARLALLAMRRVELRIDRELKHAARQLTSRLGSPPILPAAPRLRRCPTGADQILYSLHLLFLQF